MVAYVRYKSGGAGFQRVSDFDTVAIDDQVVFSSTYRNLGWIINQLPLHTGIFTVGLTEFRFFSTVAPATGSDNLPDDQAGVAPRPLSWTESKLQFLDGADVVAEFLFQAVRGWSNLPPNEDSDLPAKYVKYRTGGYQGCTGVDHFARIDLDIYSGWYRNSGTWIPNQLPLVGDEILTGVVPSRSISLLAPATGGETIPDEQQDPAIPPRSMTWKETLLVFYQAAPGNEVIAQFLESAILGWSDTPPEQ